MRAKLVSLALSLAMLATMFAASFQATAAPMPVSASGFETVTEWRETFYDDFSQNSGRWTYYSAATRIDGAVRLTPNVNGMVGAIWFDVPVYSDFEVEFKYKIQGGESYADGMCFMFYKDRMYVPGSGGNLGFVTDFSCGTPGIGTVPGYGVEFDTYLNGEESSQISSAPHLGIIKENVFNHLDSYTDGEVRTGGSWQNVKVIVDGANISVFLGNMTEPKLSWTGLIDHSYGGFGFAAGTGGLNDNHYVDDVRISEKVTYLVEADDEEDDDETDDTDGNATVETNAVGEVVTDYVYGTEPQVIEPQVRESDAWTLGAANTVLLAITLIVVVLLANWMRRKR